MSVDAAVILAGGVGKRLWPLTATRAKPLLPLPGGTTIVSRLVRQVSKLTRRIIVVVPPGGREHFRRVFGKEGLSVVLVEQETYEQGGYGSGAGALAGLEAVGDAGTVLVLNGDIVVHDSVFERLRGLAEAGRYGVVAVEVTAEPGRYGVVKTDGGVLEEIVEKPLEAGGPVLVNAGIYLLPYRLFLDALRSLRPSPRGELEVTDAVNTVARRSTVTVVKAGGDLWLDVGTWWDFLAASRRVLDWMEGCEAEGEIDEKAVVRGRICGRGFRIEAYSVVEGPVWLGEGVVVGPQSHIRSYTVMHDGAEVGAFVEVKASVLLENVKAKHLAYIGDSVVGEGSNIAAGTVIANLRHDSRAVKSCSGGRVVNTGLRKLGAVLGAWVKTGVNSSVSPGTRIGPCSWLEEGAVARHDVPACSLVGRNGEIRDISRLNSGCCKRISFGRGVGLCG